jgi:hypothetical protein
MECSNNSSYHDAEMKSDTKRGKETQKPVSVIDSKWMGGIDLKGQLLQMYLVEGSVCTDGTCSYSEDF